LDNNPKSEIRNLNMKLRPFLLADCATRLCRNQSLSTKHAKERRSVGGSFLLLQRGLKQSPEKFVQDAMNLAYGITSAIAAR
jgi:hypothetical protein